jgi:hypothetical protein
MGAAGYAEFHRGFLPEVKRKGLIVDVRFNRGGNVSSLILEKLARRRVAYVAARWMQLPQPYPEYAIAGPMVALTNEFAGSDGDIFSHAFKLMKLGPLIGKRTWGGVIGILPAANWWMAHRSPSRSTPSGFRTCWRRKYGTDRISGRYPGITPRARSAARAGNH